MRTGYFADEKRFTKVHLVDNTDKPICGSIIRNKKFYFCAHNIVHEYIECSKCRKRVTQ